MHESTRVVHPASRLYVAIIVALACLATALGLWLANGRPLATYDSAFYISAARHVAAGDGFVTDIVAFDDTDLVEPLKRWPPLYSLLASVFVLLGASGLDPGTWVSALAFAATVAGIAEAARRAAGVRAGIVAALFALTATSFWVTATSVGSDMLYTAFGAWWLAELVAYAQGGKERRLWVSAMFGALATLTRWVGFTFGIAGALWLGLRLLRRPEWRSLWQSFAYGMLVVGPTLVLQLLNPISSGEAALQPSPGQAPAFDTLRDIFTVAAADLGLWPASGGGLAVVLVVLRWFAIGVVVYMVLRVLRGVSAEKDAGLLSLVLPGLAYAAVYAGVVSYTRSIQYVPGIETRYVNPIYPVLLAALGVCAMQLSSRVLDRGKAAVVMLLACALVFAAVPRWTEMVPAARASRAGAGLSAWRWREGEGFALVRELAPDALISPTAAYAYVLTEVPSRPPGPDWDAEDIAQACQQPPLGGLDVLVLVVSPDEAWVRKTVDVEGLLDPDRFDVLLHTDGELVVRPRL